MRYTIVDETFWGLYEAQISALRSCASPEEANMIMLETAKFLVEHIDLSDATIAQYDKFGLRKLFSAHNALGGAVTSFYEAEKDRLDPVAQTGVIGQKVTTISEQITAMSDALDKLQEFEKDLFDKESELAALEKELEEWKRKTTHLHDVEANAAAEIQRYKEQFDQLDAVITGYADEVAFWEAHLGENSAIIEKMKIYGVASLDDLLSKIETLRSNIQQALGALDEAIKKIIDQETEVREAVLRRQNKIV